MKKCSKCKKILSKNNFTKHRGFKDGLDYWCRDCKKEISKIYTIKNKKHISEYLKQYYKKHKEDLCAKSLGYYQDNKDKRLVQIKEWIENNKDKSKIYNHNWYQKNRDVVRNNTKKYQRLYPERFDKYNADRRARKINAFGSYTSEEWRLLKERCGHICLRCKKKEPEISLTQDHIIPLSRGGTNYIFNIQPLCQSCNSIKQTKIISYV